MRKAEGLAPEELERQLCDYFLVRSHTDQSPIRSFEVSPKTVAEALWPSVVYADEKALEDFRANLPEDGLIVSALEHGRYPSMEGLPGCFMYLTLTLLIAGATDDELLSLGAFRAKLTAFLGIHRSFSNLEGVAKMWRDLRSWLAHESSVDSGYGKLILPDPGAWTHIGYTLKLSFPSRRDRMQLVRFLTAHPFAIDSLRQFVAEFRATAIGPNSSLALKQAFEEFHSEILAGRRMLADHRFWRLVINLARGSSEKEEVRDLSLEMTRDMDEEWTFTLAEGQKSREYFSTLEQAVEGARKFQHHELSRALDKGAIAFQQIGHGRWRAASDVRGCAGHIMIGLSPATRNLWAAPHEKLVNSGIWLITQRPVLVAVAERALSRLFRSWEWDPPIGRASVADGIKSDTYWLGRPSVLPQIFCSDAPLAIERIDGAQSVARCEEQETGVFRIQAAGALDGRYVIFPATDDAIEPAWTRRIAFVANAVPRAATPTTSDPSDMDEWTDLAECTETSVFPDISWAETSSELDDLIEAAYAAGKSGWNEIEIVQLIRRCLRDSVSPWDVLRSLQDAAILEPALRAQWRGRIWRLIPPSISSLQAKKGCVVIAHGALPALMVDDFRRTVLSIGGQPFRRTGVSPLAPALIGATDVDSKHLSDALGWKIEPQLVAGKSSLAIQVTERRPDRYLEAAHWSWEANRFVAAPPGAPVESVSLKRMKHPGERDHDIYVVAHRGEIWNLLSRPASIALAHVLMKRPLFDYGNNHLRRISKEGALPDALARLLRCRHLANSGPSAIGSGYLYPASERDLALFSRLLPFIYSGDVSSTGAMPAEAVSSAIHSGGRVRLVWRDGKLSTTKLS